MSGYAFHPLAEIFPLLEGPEFTSLVDDIAEHGQRELIVLFDGQILDGRNRYRACNEAGVEPKFAAYDGDDPAAFVVSLNLRRRHLDESQRAMVAVKLANVPHGGDRSTKSPIGDLKTQAQAAELLNVGKRSVERAREVLDEGAPELVQAVERGVVSVSAAADVSSLPKPKQVEIVARGEKEIVAEANRIKRARKERRKKERKKHVAELAAASNTTSRRHDLFLGPCINALNGDAGTVDWIITDPPYPKEFLSAYEDLAKVAEHALKPGGSLLCMVGQSYLPEVIAALDAKLTYQWTLAYLTPGGQAAQIFPRRVNTFWKPVLWFVKGEFAGDWIGDAITSKVNDNDKRFHEWGQSESGMRDLMSRFVKPGDTVLDPFMGGGTTGVIALELGAKFFGFEIDSDAYNEAAVRIDGTALVA